MPVRSLFQVPDYQWYTHIQLCCKHYFHRYLLPGIAPWSQLLSRLWYPLKRFLHFRRLPDPVFPILIHLRWLPIPSWWISLPYHHWQLLQILSHHLIHCDFPAKHAQSPVPHYLVYNWYHLVQLQNYAFLHFQNCSRVHLHVPADRFLLHSAPQQIRNKKIPLWLSISTDCRLGIRQSSNP